MAEKKSAKQMLEDARNFDCDTLIQADKLGESLKLSDVASIVRRTFILYGMLDSNVLDVLPQHVGDTLADRLREVFTLCENCLAFDPQQPKSQAKRNSLRVEADRLFQQAWGDSHPMLAASARYEQTTRQDVLNAALADHSQRVSQAIESVNSQAKEFAELNASTLDQASSGLSAAKQAAEAAGVHFQADKFKNAADTHASMATNWLIGLVAICAVLAIWAIVGAWALKGMERWTGISVEPVQLVASKVLVFGVLSFGAILASRSYFAHRHNAVINLHRQNALQTYKAIVEATGDDASRNTILQQAAACIFAPQSSGYSKESNGKPSSVNIIETIGSHLTGRQEF